MKSLLFASLLLILCANAHSQLRKCTGSDGRVTYSDVACSGNAITGSIKNQNGNTIDTSGMREHAEKAQNSRSQPSGDFGLAEALAMDPNKGGKNAAIRAALAQQQNATNLRIAEITAGAQSPIVKTPSENPPSYQTRDRYGNLANSQDNYKTKDRYGNLVDSQESYATKDRFGNLVDSRSCYKTKDNFGKLVDSAGCSK